MDASEALNLYDSYWFEMEILTDRSTTSSPSPPDSPPETPTMASIYMQIQKQQAPPPPILRSVSEDLYTKPSFHNIPASPDSVLTSQLRTILSGKEATGPRRRKVPRAASGSNSPPKARRAAKKGPASKSLSSLEFEEVKGFMDLGFVFSEEDKDSRLASILPGLQRLGKKVDGEVDESAIPRPYLSEAWAAREAEKLRNPVTNWRVPAMGLGSEMDMKDSLRLWAHTVASTVR
ncbi:unnamed protein product [Linum tenue]|uniref:Uncharacterized protein n=2 Tax=Linum tenue TaxID=586396 RepID=A0AAV0RTT0_9ROSI|nr:unnamed protein product [Linum tenue]